MESVARPPHRRKHSTAANAFSLKNPYDDVLLSNGGGGKRKSFEANEYAEIFSVSTSIPVLDLSGLDERAGSDGHRSSKLDYSGIFGGFRNDDVAVPYEELFNGSAKKTKPRVQADACRPQQESVSPHSSGNKRRSSVDASDQSVDGVKQHFNMSFNRTNQRDNDELNGKTHIAELHAIPGFTYFVDGAPQVQKTEDRPVPPLIREVSRTWSFSAEVEAVKNKGGLSCDKSHVPNKSHNMDGVNLESHFSKVLPPTIRPSNFTSKEDALKKVAGEFSPPFFDEEFDENSVAAVSAAALKQAIDQAQESIRLAKMIMERKREGYQDEYKSTRGMKVPEKETKIVREAYGSKENKAREKYEELNSIFTMLNGKFAPAPSFNDPLTGASKVEVKRVLNNVEATKGQGEVSAGGGKLFDSNCSRSETICMDEKVEMEKVEEAETHGEATDFPGLVANAESRTAVLEPGKVCNNNSSMLSTSKLGSGVTNHDTKEPEVVEELAERALSAPRRMQELKRSGDEPEQCQATFFHAKGPETRVERVQSPPQRPREKERDADEACRNLRIAQEDKMTKERENDMDDKGKCEKNFEEHEEMHNVEYWRVLRSVFDNFLNKSSILLGNEILEQEKTEKKSKNDSMWEENGNRHGKPCDGEENGMREKEIDLWFGSKEQMKEALEEEISEREPDVFPEVREVEKKFDEVHDPETDDKKQNHFPDADEPKSPEELEQNEAEERRMVTSECEAAETIPMQAYNCAEDAENGFIDANSSEARTFFSETQEAVSVDLNYITEELQEVVKSCNENNNLRQVTGTFAAIDRDEEVELLFQQDDNGMRGTDSLRRSASEEIFVESNLHNASEDHSYDGKTENVGVTDSDPEEELPDIHDAAQEYFAKLNGQSLTEVYQSDNRTAEFDLTDVRHVLEQMSASDEGSVSTSSPENIDDLSAHESEECPENVKDKTSNKEEIRNELEMVANERKCVEEQSEGLHGESKEMDKSIETERAVEESINIEKAREQNFETDDHQQRIEAIKRGREREKDRIVVERAIREARERAFAEARERAERAAVERAAAEARQRARAEAREKLEKASVKQPADKASIEAKLRAERAAVERATAEARERALEKARSQKNPTERVCSSSRNNVLKHSFSSSDLENGTTESPQRRKARLERHQRIMERAAKALAEKNMRDHLAHREQAERNRLADSLDADIKRWATGKEGNLRALLSTLQYILGPSSGWQPISLTEIITAAAVKKAYRKATLYVHPDKLQQRGASIQQKYICEKVFDLLKAAWNRFNSEER